MSKLEPTRTYLNPTATEVLRRMLDERGVEYVADDEPSAGLHFTSWDADGFMWEADDRDERIYLSADRLITPEQAIAATLGSCSCSNDCTNSERTETCYDTGESRIFHCSECGLGLDDVFIDDEEYYPFADFPRFCPFCGAKVVEPTTNDVDAEVDA